MPRVMILLVRTSTNSHVSPQKISIAAPPSSLLPMSGPIGESTILNLQINEST